MSDEPTLAAGVIEEAASRLGYLLEEFREEIGREPTLAEFLEISSLATTALSDALTEVDIPLGFRVELSGSRRYVSTSDSRVGDLDDNVFVEASDLFGFLVDQMSSAGSPLVSGEVLGKLLTRTLNAANCSFLDVNASEIARIHLDRLTPSFRANIGDVVAIPVVDGLFYLASIVARNRFGLALGIHAGPSTSLDLQELPSTGRQRVVYTDDLEIRNGTWPIVGNDQNLLSRFPSEPEIYHGTVLFFPGVHIGEHGSAESPDGVMRDIGADEARRVGLLDGSYQQSYMSSVLQRLLHEEALG